MNNNNYHDDSSDELLPEDIESLDLDSDESESDEEIIQLPVFTHEDFIKYIKQIQYLKAKPPS